MAAGSLAQVGWRLGAPVGMLGGGASLRYVLLPQLAQKAALLHAGRLCPPPSPRTTAVGSELGSLHYLNRYMRSACSLSRYTRCLAGRGGALLQVRYFGCLLAASHNNGPSIRALQFNSSAA